MAMKCTMNSLLRILLFVIVAVPSPAQVIRAGIKGGFQVSWVNFDASAQKDKVNAYPVPGFNAGAVLAFKVRDRYFLHTEYLYSTKGKVITGDKKSLANGVYDPNLKDKVVYSFIDIPVIFTIHFKGKAGKSKQFKWFAGAGPVFSYWLGGRGKITSGDIMESAYKPAIKYKIQFGGENEDPEVVNVPDANRWQLGLTIGGGLVFEPDPKHRIIMDVRHEYGHTRLGKSNAIHNVFPAAAIYQDNLQARNNGVRFSLMYVVEYNTDPKSRNKGKSTIREK